MGAAWSLSVWTIGNATGKYWVLTLICLESKSFHWLQAWLLKNPNTLAFVCKLCLITAAGKENALNSILSLYSSSLKWRKDQLKVFPFSWKTKKVVRKPTQQRSIIPALAGCLGILSGGCITQMLLGQDERVDGLYFLTFSSNVFRLTITLIITVQQRWLAKQNQECSIMLIFIQNSYTTSDCFIFWQMWLFI